MDLCYKLTALLFCFSNLPTALLSTLHFLFSPDHLTDLWCQWTFCCHGRIHELWSWLHFPWTTYHSSCLYPALSVGELELNDRPGVEHKDRDKAAQPQPGTVSLAHCMASPVIIHHGSVSNQCCRGRVMFVVKKEWALFDVDFRCAFVMFKFSAECAFLACQWAEMAKKKKKKLSLIWQL